MTKTHSLNYKGENTSEVSEEVQKKTTDVLLTELLDKPQFFKSK